VTVHNIEAAFLRKAAKNASKASGKRKALYDIQAKAEFVRDGDRKLQIDRIILEAKNGLDFPVCRTAIASLPDFRGLLREMKISGDSEGEDDYYEELIGDLRRGETVRLDCVVAEDLKRYGFNSH
jgi:hypothetical protein